ncbi:carbohydrate-binding protein [Grimontia sp. AD028]|uniref:polysaccharide deacetylase family protein n=1 Tax=Grimontia sp. AD028 TaxID=1581149 RepID=UPI00061AB6A6|nr:polysaccharide deacetylase family protein [Grimontia sp. AD028]KKD62403.1 carbohydrate-binding protein [Grimontia sp. AD028]
MAKFSWHITGKKTSYSLFLPLVMSAQVLAMENAYPPSQLSPIDTAKTPMFVSLGFDDNNDLEGLKWVLDTLASHKNPNGMDKHANRNLTASFFMLCGQSRENEDVLNLWRRAHQAGHDIGNHTETHPDDKVNWNPLDSWMTQEAWQQEVTLCNQFLTSAVEDGGIGIEEAHGFRAPFLTYNDNTLKAVIQNGIAYDVSFPAGITPAHDGTNNYWPYTLENGSPEHDIAVNGGWKPQIANYSGLWEVPAHTLIVPPDNLTSEYGIDYSLRDKIAKRVPWFDRESGKGDNFDWNLYSEPAWGAAGLSGDEVFAIYAYNLDLRLKGNRAPLVLGLHSGFYGLVNGQEQYGMPGSDTQSRQAALSKFIEYALSKSEVRFVSHIEIIDWMKNPEPLTLCPKDDWNVYTTYVEGSVVTYGGENYQAKWWTTQQIPGLYENSPWELIPSCTAN